MEGIIRLLLEKAPWVLSLLVGIVVVLVGLVIYAVVAGRGVQLWPPAFSPKPAGVAPKQPEGTVAKHDITGDWKYRCTVIRAPGTPFREWGGKATITKDPALPAVQWKLFGQRLWQTTEDASGKKALQQLQTSYPWQTTWGIITSEPAVRFEYTITTPEKGTMSGYAYGAIKASEDMPNEMIGGFYQLPPDDPVHGKLEFRRMVNPDDICW